MSDELPAGSINLEDDSPAPASPPAPPVDPPVEAAAVTPPAEPEADPGPQVVPVGALVAERKQRQQLEQQLRELAPYVDFVKNNPRLTQPAEPQPPSSAAPEVDPDAREAAQLMDYYKADGWLDVERGAKWLALQDRRAQRASQEAVKPLQEITAQQKSSQNFNAALTVKDAAGISPTRESLEAVWRMMPSADTSDPQVAGVMAALALGLDRMKPQVAKPAPPAAPPLVTEGSGGTPRPKVTFSALEERIARERNQSPQAWHELTKDHQKGRPTVLED